MLHIPHEVAQGQKVPAPIVVLFNLCRKYFVLAKFFIKRKNYEL